jgi:hypothetical protein
MRKIAALTGALLVCLAAHAHAQSCQPAWDYHVPGVDGVIGALAVFNDGSGSALYAGEGYSTRRPIQEPRWVRKWDGSSWSVVGGGFLPSSSTYPAFIDDLEVFDDGNGPSLYAAGHFQTAGGTAVKGLARWDGQAWSPVGGGVTGSCSSYPTIYDLRVHDDGTGPALYAAGNLLEMGGVPAHGVAKWNGSTWSPLGTGIGSSCGCCPVLSLGVFDDGTGPMLYAGGIFIEAGGVPAEHIAKWDSQSWSAVGSGITGYGGTFTTVDSMVTHDDGTGLALYVGGNFLFAGGQPADHVARWNGTAWSQVGAGISVVAGGGIAELATFDPGGNPALYAGGGFGGYSGSTNLGRIAKWNGSEWLPLANSVRRTDGPSRVLALAGYDDGTGPLLYVGGDFTLANNQPANYIAAWMECAVFDSVPTLSRASAIILIGLVSILGVAASRRRTRS